MPYNIVNPDQSISASTRAAEYEYEYPRDLNLKPGSELHQRILTRTMQYGLESSRITSQRHRAWNSVDETLTAYIPISHKEREVLKKDPRKPVSIVFPYSYAILETLISYMVAAFFPDPMFRYEGVSPEDIAGAELMQKIIALHCSRMKVALNLHTFFRDAGAYGFGVVSPQWTVRKGKRDIKRERGMYNGLGDFISDGFERVTDLVTLFEGNSLENIDPYMYLPDPNVPIHDVQRGEFVGWMDHDNFMNLLDMESSDEDMFNVRYLRHTGNKSSSIFAENKSRRTSRTHNLADTRNTIVTDPIDLLHMYVKLIPREWKLGSSDTPEKWLFTVAADSIVIRAKPLNLNHDLFPVCVAAPDFDGYSPLAYSRLEILSGMQTVIDWLFNSHITNVRKAINDVLIVDPYLLNIEDLKDPEPGGIVRLRRPAWGKGVENAAKQLEIVDITRNNLNDVGFVIQYMQQVAGTDNPVMGNLRRGGPERLSAREFQGTAQGAISRLERVAKIIGIQGMQDIGYMFAHHTQQLMSEDVWVKSIGQWPEAIQRQFQVAEGNRVRVSPMDILVDYDLLTRDGSIPGGNFSDSWLELFRAISENPLLMQRFDITRIFKFIATNLGAKNVDDFEMRVPQEQNAQPQIPVNGTVADDESVMREVERGNLVPLMEGENGVIAR